MSDAHEVVVVFAGGDPMRWDVRGVVPSHATVVAADSGLHVAQAAGVRVDEVVGDLDSVQPAALAAAEAAGARVERHPVAKDHTDFELAMRRALEHAPDELVVVGGHGGRLDHELGNLFALASPAFASVRVQAHLGTAHAHVVRDAVDLHGRVGELVSLLPVHGTVHGVVTAGLEFPLRDEPLHAGSTRGVSNTFARAGASVHIRSGTLLVVVPHAHLYEGDAP